MLDQYLLQMLEYLSYIIQYYMLYILLNIHSLNNIKILINHGHGIKIQNNGKN